MRRACGLSFQRPASVYAGSATSFASRELPSFSSTSFQTVPTLDLEFKRFATKKTGGCSKNGRRANPKFRGFRLGHGSKISTGNIILTQKGVKFNPGWNVGCAKDGTLYALTPGTVWIDKEVAQLNVRGDKRVVHVLPSEEAERRQRLRQAKFSMFYEV